MDHGMWRTLRRMNEIEVEDASFVAARRCLDEILGKAGSDIGGNLVGWFVPGDPIFLDQNEQLKKLGFVTISDVRFEVEMVNDVEGPVYLVITGPGHKVRKEDHPGGFSYRLQMKRGPAPTDRDY